MSNLVELEDGSMVNLDNVTAIHRKAASYSHPERTMVHFMGGLPLEVNKPYAKVRNELVRVADGLVSER